MKFFMTRQEKVTF